ncbi:UvrB/UvrC motif-containing protein [Candidatus Parcubacteria bacterium]|nr:UvrB/UvrC motif-containing protein [Candidatus Parcubacteria bacterium]
MKKFKIIQIKNLQRLPKTPGVYCFFDGSEILYIGKAVNLRERVKNHFQQPTFRDQLFLNKVQKIGYIKTGSQIEALILEANLIKKYQPKYNIVWRDDKNYFFVGQTKEDFPRIFLTHQPKPQTLSKQTPAEFVGPFVDGKALKETLKILRKIFPFRSCKTLPKRPCLWYHLDLCPGPCLLKGKFFEEIKKTSRLKKICEKNAQNIIDILREGKDFVLKKLKREMKKSAKNQEFEEAARIRDQIERLEKILAHSRILEKIEMKKENWPEIEQKIKEIFGVKRASKIEAFDISNIRGRWATGSMVTFFEGKPEKNLYRKFKIKMAEKINDISMLKEVLERRFLHKEWEFPDLILLDGGRAQLNGALSLKEKFKEARDIKFLALAKGEKKLFVEGKKTPFYLEKLPQEVSNIFFQINSEAHRFAITYHKKLREKSLFEK